MKKRILSILLAFCMMMSFVPMMASAIEIYIDLKIVGQAIQMTDGYDDDLCRELTRIKRDGTKIPYTNDQHSFNFNRMYDASNKDITLQLWFENSAYNTYLGGFRGTITITALD